MTAVQHAAPAADTARGGDRGGDTATPTAYPVAWAEVAWTCHLAGVRSGAVADLARRLGVPVDVLYVAGVGWHARERAWTWPMRGAAGEVVGIRTRHADETKRAVRGSRAGWMGPACLLGRGPLVVAEGPTDAAAAAALGLDAVGRPSAYPGRQADMWTLAQCRGRDVVVVPDADPVGVAGARAFAAQALLVARSVKVLTLPLGVKDLRAWFLAGLGRDELRARIHAAPAIRAHVEVVL